MDLNYQLNNPLFCDLGSAHVFQNLDSSGNHWTQVAKLLASDNAADNRFGESISMYHNLIAVRAPSDKEAGVSRYLYIYIYKISNYRIYYLFFF